ncbi:sialate O-acetylesterase [Poritiphilus flavus]|uniref:Sialate O-acetylesterase n=1 Tax=Poritiphilus flavus TaxID=2697053 RepID=A0A6L9EHW1_9FLAO|nr:sialate O-acetylesterase [Poritiphilus flavus]NAS14078.1 sialate O-acetylesterase [Poritiphilus flavus]
MKRLLPYILLIHWLYGCQKEAVEVDYEKPYNVILIAGQSNTYSGVGLDSKFDHSHEQIKQLGRFGSDNLRVIKAQEPLQHHSKAKGKVGFAMTFAKLLFDHLKDGSDILIIPCGHGGTGFTDRKWNKGDELYQDAIARVKLVLHEYKNSELKAILWHQGERDIGNGSYQVHLDDFIQNFRQDIGQENVPFILGGMVPFWVEQEEARQKIQEIISETPERLGNVGYVDPEYPFLIEKTNNFHDEVHFDAKGQRELGRRYFNQFKAITGK